MARYKIIPVFILTGERRTGFELKKYLEEKSRFPFPVVAEVYLSPTELVPHLSPFDKNYILVDHLGMFLDDLRSILSLPENKIYSYEIILRSPADHQLVCNEKDRSCGTPLVRDYYDFAAVERIIRLLGRQKGRSKMLKDTNYVVAGLLMMIVIILTIVIL